MRVEDCGVGMDGLGLSLEPAVPGAHRERMARGRGATGLDIVPDTLLPQQFATRVQRCATLHPERQLMAAVLQDAVLGFRKHAGAQNRAGRQLFSELEAWFAAEDLESPFSFLNICDTLDLDAAGVRAILQDWLRQDPRRIDESTARGRSGNSTAATRG